MSSAAEGEVKSITAMAVRIARIGTRNLAPLLPG
jgi:hypothetical protein